MAQHDDFNGEVRVTATDETDQVKHAAERPVEEREGHRRMLAGADTPRQSEAHGPWTVFSARLTYTRPDCQRKFVWSAALC